MTYFRFIKWLMFLNIYIMIIMFCVITVPYLALGPYTFNSSLTDANVSGYREAIECTTEYEIYHSNLTETESIGQQVLDLLQGTVSSHRSIIILDLSPFEKISNQPFNTSQFWMNGTINAIKDCHYLNTHFLFVAGLDGEKNFVLRSLLQ